VLDLLITGGHVVTPFEEGVLEIGIEDGKVAFVSRPGAVEPHAHIHEPTHRGWTRGREDWLQPPEGATRAALHGGTTMVISFAFMDVHVEQQEFDANIAVEHRKEVFTGRSYTDFAFHPVFAGTPSDATLASIADAVADGTATFKFFTTDLTTTQRGIRLDTPVPRVPCSLREVLHNCMCFSLDDYDKPDGAKYHIGMGLRPPRGRRRALGWPSRPMSTPRRTPSRWRAPTSSRRREDKPG
jgi:hypothetical protein